MKRIVVIGGGVAGLSAGIYAAMNGYEPIVLEKHRQPGGLCTAWSRYGASGRYTLEGCIHYVLGLSSTGPFRRMWDELGVSRPVLPVSELFTLRHPDGTILPVCTDIDELAARMRSLAPGDDRAIRRFVADVKLFARYDIPIDVPAEIPVWSKIRAMGRAYPDFLLRFLRYRFVSARTYARRFRSPILRWAVARLAGHPDYPAIWTMMVHSRMHRGEAGYPVGGSLELAYDLEERLLELGGSVEYGSRVCGLRTNGRAVTGVLLDDGTIVDADYVVSAGDLRHSLEWLSDAGIPSRPHEFMLRVLRPGNSVAQVSFGVRAGASVGSLGSLLDADDSESIVLGPTRRVAGVPVHRLVVRNYRRDHLLAPNECRTVTCQMETDFSWWAALQHDRRAYREQKRLLAEGVLVLLERQWPGISHHVEVVDVATPLTSMRYTSNHDGSAYGVRPDRRGFGWPASYEGPRGSNFFFAGHWLCPGGGVHRAAQSGRYAIQRLCGREQRAFVAHLAVRCIPADPGALRPDPIGANASSSNDRRRLYSARYAS